MLAKLLWGPNIPDDSAFTWIPAGVNIDAPFPKTRLKKLLSNFGPRAILCNGLGEDIELKFRKIRNRYRWCNLAGGLAAALVIATTLTGDGNNSIKYSPVAKAQASASDTAVANNAAPAVSAPAIVKTPYTIINVMPEPQMDEAEPPAPVAVVQPKKEQNWTVHFDQFSAAITADRGVLKSIVAATNDASTCAALVVEGHTDRRGSLKSNMELSRNRANAVKHWLKLSGVKVQITTVGLGNKQLLDKGTSKRANWINRRGEVKCVTAAEANRPVRAAKTAALAEKKR